MLEIKVKYPDEKVYDVQFEHSLLAISKWEAKYEKPFFGKDNKSGEEVLEYFRLMIVSDSHPLDIHIFLTREQMTLIQDYLGTKQSATWFSEHESKKPSRVIHTSEVIYSWMVALQIPFICEEWNINRLMTLIRIVTEAQTPKKKMSRQATAKHYAELNAKRLKETGSRG